MADDTNEVLDRLVGIEVSSVLGEVIVLLDTSTLSAWDARTNCLRAVREGADFRCEQQTFCNADMPTINLKEAQ